MRRLLSAGVLLAVMIVGSASIPGVARAACADFDHSHEAWTKILAAHVNDKGRVDYKGLIKEDKDALKSYLGSLASCSSSDFNGWTTDQQKAFLINAYNANTVKIIIDNYPLKSIRSIGFIPGSIFKKKIIDLKVLGKSPISLDVIEHDTLRPKYKDPRVHFAVNCASTSCPQLRNEAFVAERLDEQLDDQGRIFLSDTSKNRLSGDTVELSMIFKWFSEDFQPKGGAAKFAAQYASGDFKKALESNPKIEFLTYDWSLNEQK